jgi:hypothetical protein
MNAAAAIPALRMNSRLGNSRPVSGMVSCGDRVRSSGLPFTAFCPIQPVRGGIVEGEVFATIQFIKSGHRVQVYATAGGGARRAAVCTSGGHDVLPVYMIKPIGHGGRQNSMQPGPDDDPVIRTHETQGDVDEDRFLRHVGIVRREILPCLELIRRVYRAGSRG